MLYFCYGSNMSSLRLQHRAPSSQFVAVARLEKHDLRFHKSGKDGSAKCDAFNTNNPDDQIFGVIYQISEPDKVQLDRIEGLGKGYDEKIVEISALTGELFTATTYYATKVDPSLKPYHWYKEHVLKGAEENRLPKAYIHYIANIESVDDYDIERHQKELAIYR